MANIQPDHGEGRWPSKARAACAFTVDACLRELIDHVRHTPRAWVATLGEIAAHWRTQA